MNGLRIGYHWFGFLADRKLSKDGVELSTPDGNATYTWAIVHESVKRGHTVIPLGERRDIRIFQHLGDRAFRAFSQLKRAQAYGHLLDNGWFKGSDRSFPELDVLLLEWRFPIPGRNTPDAVGNPGYQRDLERQVELLRHYSEAPTRILAWDLDHKMVEADELSGRIDAILETSVHPRKINIPRVRVEPPCVLSELDQHSLRAAATVPMAYIGSRYERDEMVDEWIAPLSEIRPFCAHFFGKWEPRQEVKRRWPNISFHERIGVADFHAAYRNAAIVPLLAKQSYLDTGFITPRPWEALLFGSFPMGIHTHLGVEQYTDRVARTPLELLDEAKWLMEARVPVRKIEREQAIHKLRHMDAGCFVDTLERLYDKIPEGTADGQEQQND